MPGMVGLAWVCSEVGVCTLMQGRAWVHSFWAHTTSALQLILGRVLGLRVCMNDQGALSALQCMF